MMVEDRLWSTPARLERARGLITPAETPSRRSLQGVVGWASAAAGFAALAACLVFVATPVEGPGLAGDVRADASTARVDPPRAAAPTLPAPVRVAPRAARTAADPVATRSSGDGIPTSRPFALSGVTGPAVFETQSRDVSDAPAGEAQFGWIDVATPGPTPWGDAVDAAAEARPHIAVVIDDIGLDVEASTRALALPGPMTLSILPYAPAAASLAGQARRAGHDVFVHLPMEPLGLDDPGPRALTTWLSVEEIRARATAAFDAVPGAVGFNNHMGSRFTSCGACLEPVAEVARARGFVALDSVTGRRTVLQRAAARAGLPVLSRDVFVDHVRDADAIEDALARAERLAQEAGAAVVIAHPHDVTLSALEAWLPAARRRGVTFVGAATMARS